MQITAAHVIGFLERTAAIIHKHRDELTRLDSPIGDADHGANLDRGFSAVMAKLAGQPEQEISAILKTVGMTLISTVGGASGPLYGTAFLRASTALAGKSTLAGEDVQAAIEAALEGIMTRGKAQRGEKTMIDAIGPGLDALKIALAEGSDLQSAMRTAVAATEAGMLATIPMLATKGRASYLGERSIGHQDPGATSAYYIACAMLATLED